MCSGLAKPNPMTPQEIADLYAKDGGSIFKPRDVGVLSAKYDQHAMLGYLGEEFQKTHLSDINEPEVRPSFSYRAIRLICREKSPPTILLRQ